MKLIYRTFTGALLSPQLLDGNISKFVYGTVMGELVGTNTVAVVVGRDSGEIMTMCVNFF